MKPGLTLLGLTQGLALAMPLWVPYGAFIVKSSGNPNRNPYLGEAGSTYDSAANPAQTVGVVSYNPNAPLPPVPPPAMAPIR